MSSRPVHEVFTKSTLAPPANMLAERFGSSGKYTVVELEKPEPAGLRSGKPAAPLAPGARVKVVGRFGLGEIIEKAEENSWRILFDDGVEAIVLADRISTDLEAASSAPKLDNRTLYEKLKEQRDAKQEEFDHKHTFKNQMDHWRLDEDDAAFELDRVEKLQADSERQRADADEDAFRYKAAMLSRTKPASDVPAVLLAPVLPPVPAAGAGAQVGAKRKAPFAPAPLGIIKAIAKKGASEAAARAAPPAAAVAAVTSALPGMSAYDASDSDDPSE